MKTATIPPVRVEPKFRKELEQVLQEGETLAQFVENSVRAAVMRRRDQSEFVRRGLLAIERTKAAGDGIAADKVIAKLEVKLQAAKDKQRRAR
jgi:hypothetical protein